MNPVPVHREIESLISYDHTSLMGQVCEHQFFSLNPIFEPILTPEPLHDLSQMPESVLVPVLPESKSIIPSFYTPFWDKGVDKIDSEIILKI